MTTDDSAYYKERAIIQEEIAALHAANPDIAAIHRALGARYRAKAHRSGLERKHYRARRVWSWCPRRRWR